MRVAGAGHDDALRLPDGRRLAYTRWGEADEPAVIFWYGIPGSRVLCPDAAATGRAGVNLVTFDRPGYGGSDPVERYDVGGGVDDAVALLDHLEIERAGMVGFSGGGPYAAAVAHARPDRVRALALVSAPGPLEEVPGARESLGERQGPTADVALHDPRRARRAVERFAEPYLADPVSYLRWRPGPDADLVADPAVRAALESEITEAWSSGVSGYACDLVARWRPWGFRLDQIAVATTVFWGAHDRHNGADAQTFAARIAGARLVVWDDAAHLGLISHWAEVLAAVG